MDLVIVESPAKAKTINKYLGANYQVVASYGHVRDLPSKEGSVEPDNDFMIHYDLSERGAKTIKEIAECVKKARIIYLATDPDREGESISWHIIEALKEKKKIDKKIILKRIIFNEINKKSVLQAIENPRDIDMDLVNAQQARRALDYLVGFSLSPILWRKLPGSKSAGRVQSVALRLICEREDEIERFISEEYWDIKCEFKTSKNEKFSANLTYFDKKKLEKLSIKNEIQAEDYIKQISSKKFSIAEIIPKEQQRHPAAPFTTSSLQQEASRKLGFSSKFTMQVAQKLYEGIEIDNEVIGLITYMRTDAVQLSQEAVNNIRKLIEKKFGKDYIPNLPRSYKTKTKNAQEAHEAIRPTNIDLLPQQAKKFLDDKQYKLYELIWNRTVACQMESAIFDQMIVNIKDEEKSTEFRAIGSKIKFDGFYRLYREGIDDEVDEEHKILPIFSLNEKLDIAKISKNQHFTEAAPRYGEASLIKKLEELGIGRPSTYAPIISVLQERDYVKLDKKKFIPEERGILVTCFLSNFFKKYIEYDFTAKLETELDEISDGKLDWKSMLRNFWEKFISDVAIAKNLDINYVIERLNEDLENHLFNKNDNKSEAKICPNCRNILSLRLGKFGAYIACSAYPECKYSRQIGDQATEDASQLLSDSKIIGKYKDTDEDILLKKGPYGFYLQIGEGEKPKRVTIPKNFNIDEISLEQAISLLELPKEIGIYKKTGKIIKVSIGPYGPYVFHDGKYSSINKEFDILTLTLEEAEKILENTSKEVILKDFGFYPNSEDPIKILKGRFGPFIKYKKNNIKIPKDTNYEELTLEQVIELVSEKGSDVVKKTKKPSKKKEKKE